jgi:hypothetical protein
MSRVTTNNKHQDNHTNTSNNTSDIIALKPSLTDENNRSVLDTTIKEVKKGFRKLLIKRKELIIRLGNAFERVYTSNPESVCEEIKNCLHEEIAQRIISARDVERYCPDKWKKKTKSKNDKLSFSRTSEQPQQQIVVTREGRPVIVNETSGDTEAYPIPSEGVNEPHQSKQNGIDTNSNNQEITVDANRKEELVVKHSLNDEIAPVNKQNEGMTDRKEMFVSHVSMSLADLQKDIDVVSQTTKGEGNIFFEVLVDLGTHEVKIQFCGITRQKDVTMTSTGKGILKKSNLKSY